MGLSSDTTQKTVVPDVLVGKMLDRYRVLERIGEGGMGAVYRVEHVMLQKHMAMKLLRFELSQNQELVVRFQNEAIAASRIGQENIVAVTDFGRTPDGLVYFVMEELHGDSLAMAIAREPCFSLERTVNIAAQCCRALHAAHAVGIVHRDLKPENVILTTREGVADFVKILDFGISKIIELSPNPDGVKLTRAGMIVGTPEYMSPEQASGKTVDARSDIYSLGVVIFEMITGRLPFNAENPLQILVQHQSGEVPNFAKLMPGVKVPGKLERVVRRALAKQPEARQQSMAELLNELQACAENLELTQPALRQLGGGAKPKARISFLFSTGKAVRQQAGLEEDDALRAGLGKKHTAAWVGGALAALLVVLGLGAVLARESNRPRAPAADQVPTLAGAAAPVAPVPAPSEAKAEPKVEAQAPTPAAVAPEPTVVVPPMKPPPLDLTGERVLKAHSVPAHLRKPKPAVHETHVRPAPPPAAPVTPDPYQKVDELKKPYQ